MADTTPPRHQPTADRPSMPGYPIAPADGGGGLLPWVWAQERLAAVHNYWLATVRPEGAPHLMPVWGVWFDGALYISTGRRSRKARNLAAEARCVVSTERGDEAVVIEGNAERVSDTTLLARVATVYHAKYGWDLAGSDDPIFTIRPAVAFGLIEASESFASTATRWRFDGDAAAPCHCAG